MRNWEYAELSKKAKEYGGPKKFYAEYGDEKFNEGRIVGEDIGESRGEIKGFIEGGALTIIIGGIALAVMKLKDYRAKKTAEKIAVSREKSEAVAKEYLARAEYADVEDLCEEDYEDDE